MVGMVLALSERLATFRSVGRSDLDRRSCRHLVVHIEPRASGGLELVCGAGGPTSCPTTSSSATPGNKPFLSTLNPTEYAEGKVVCPHYGSEEVELRWFYPVAAKQSAQPTQECHID